MSDNPKANASEASEAKTEELTPSEQEKISGGVPVATPPPPPPSKVFEIKDFSFDA